MESANREDLETERERSAASGDIVWCGKSLYQSGFIAGSEGNISVRLRDGGVLITPKGARKGQLGAEDIVELSNKGERITSKRDRSPSSELGMHLSVYAARADIFACVHSHAPNATAFAVAGVEPVRDVLPEVSVFVGPIALTDYAPPGTSKVGESLQPHLSDCNAFLLKNHGLLTIGANLIEALNRHEIVEQYLKILTIAKTLGNIDQLDNAEIKRLQDLVKL